jgi:LacI family transcriptional regulator
MGMNNTTIKDVARLSGTSVATVSRVINNKTVRKENYNRIVQVMNELDFKVNNQARSLKTNKTMIVGVVIPRLDDVYFMKVAKAIQIHLSRKGYFMFLVDTDKNFDNEQMQVKRLVEEKVDGLIVVPSTNKGAYLKEYADRTSIVVLDQLLDDFEADTVVTDSINCVYESVEMFVRNGHRRIGIICGPQYLFTAKERLEGYLRVHEDYKIPIRDNLIKIGNYDVVSGYNLMKEFMEMDESDRPTAIMATNYDITKGVVMALQETGCKIPDDYSFIGYDFEELATLFSPSLNIVVEAIEEMGERIVDVLYKSMNGLHKKDAYEVFRVKPSLIIRDSVKKI